MDTTTLTEADKDNKVKARVAKAKTYKAKNQKCFKDLIFTSATDPLTPEFPC